MPPKTKTSTSVKKNIQNQKQKKAKQQQQQQQGQNVKININLGKTPAKRAPRKKPSGKPGPPPPPPPRPPPQLQTSQYIPMYINQQPAQYFTPPVSAPTIPTTVAGSAVSTIPTTFVPSSTTTTVAPSSTTTTTTAPSSIISSVASSAGNLGYSVLQNLGNSAFQNLGNWLTDATIPSTTTLPIVPPRTRPNVNPILPSRPMVPTIRPIINYNTPSIELDTFQNFTPKQNIISELIATDNLDEPGSFSFSDYANSSSDVNDFVREYTDDYTSFKTGGFLPQQSEPPSSFSNALIPEVKPEKPKKPIPAPPPLPPPPPPPLPSSFMATNQDIKDSAVKQFIDLNQENLKKLGGKPTNRYYQPSEASDITTNASEYTDMTSTDLPGIIQQAARLREQKNRESIDTIVNRAKEESKNKPAIEDPGIRGAISRAMSQRNQFIRTDEPEEDNEWDEDEFIFQPKAQPPPPPKLKPINENNPVAILPPPPQTKPQPTTGIKKPTKEEAEANMKKFQEEKRKQREDDGEELVFEEVKPKSEFERQQIAQEKKRKPGSGRPKGTGNKSEYERELDYSIKEAKADIKIAKRNIKELKKNDYDDDEPNEENMSINDYLTQIEDLEQQINYFNSLIEEEKLARKLQPINENDENEEELIF